MIWWGFFFSVLSSFLYFWDLLACLVGFLSFDDLLSWPYTFLSAIEKPLYTNAWLEKIPGVFNSFPETRNMFPGSDQRKSQNSQPPPPKSPTS